MTDCKLCFKQIDDNEGEIYVDYYDETVLVHSECGRTVISNKLYQMQQERGPWG